MLWVGNILQIKNEKNSISQYFRAWELCSYGEDSTNKEKSEEEITSEYEYFLEKSMLSYHLLVGVQVAK